MAEDSGSAAESYRVLGLRPGASTEEVRRAYRRQAMLNHPDRNPGDAAAETRFREIQDAYQVVLRSTQQRPKGAGQGSVPRGARPGRPQPGPVQRPAYRSSGRRGRVLARILLFGLFTLGPLLLILFLVWANTTTDWFSGCCWGGRNWGVPVAVPERESRKSPPSIFGDFSRPG